MQLKRAALQRFYGDIIIEELRALGSSALFDLAEVQRKCELSDDEFALGWEWVTQQHPKRFMPLVSVPMTKPVYWQPFRAKVEPDEPVEVESSRSGLWDKLPILLILVVLVAAGYMFANPEQMPFARAARECREVRLSGQLIFPDGWQPVNYSAEAAEFLCYNPQTGEYRVCAPQPLE